MMKKEYLEPETEIIRYNDEDVIMTSSLHHCGTGERTDHEYEDSNANGWCEDAVNFSCGGEEGDYVCFEHTEGCTTDCTVVNDDEW